MPIFAFMVIGLIVGLVGRVVMQGQGRRGLGLVPCALLGMIGAMVGSALGSVFSPGPEYFTYQPLSIVFAVLGSILFLVGVAVSNSRRAHA